MAVSRRVKMWMKARVNMQAHTITGSSVQSCVPHSAHGIYPLLSRTMSAFESVSLVVPTNMPAAPNTDQPGMHT